MKRTIFSFSLAALFIIAVSGQAMAKKPSALELERDAFKAIVMAHNQIGHGLGFTGNAEWNISQLKFRVEQALAASPDAKTKDELERSMRTAVHAIWRYYAQRNVDWLESFSDPKNDDISNWIISQADYYVNEAERNGANVSDIRTRLDKLYKPACRVYAERMVTRLENGRYEGWDVGGFLSATSQAIGKATASGNDVEDLRKRFVAAIAKLPDQWE